MERFQKIQNTTLNKYGIIILGSIIYAFGTNFFIVPMDLYSGGVVGTSQIIRTFLVGGLHLQLPAGFDIAGIINFTLNLPLLYLAYRSISRSFLIKTVLSVLTQTLFFSLIPIPKTPLIEDMLSACLIGGIITGAGIGLILRASGSGGGIDILGFYFTQKYKNFSIGKLSILFNAVVYVICAIFFNVQIAIYSIIYVTIFSLVLDRIHLQNINMMAMVFTKKKGIPGKILQDLHRGVTTWDGHGAYTGEGVQIFLTVISKYEISQFKALVYQEDPKAFIIINEGMSVLGNFKKRL